MNISTLGSGIYNHHNTLKYQSMGTGSINFLGNKTNNQLNNNDSSLEELADDNGFEARLKRAMEQKDEKALKEVCQSMEEIFLNIMYKQMRATVPKSGLIPESSSTEIIQSMFDEALAKETSQSRGMGIADMLYKQLYNQMNNVYKKKITEE